MENEIITEEQWMALLSPAEYAATLEKVNKVNARAAKRGWEGRIELNAERTITTRKTMMGIEIEVVQYKCSIGGTAPKLNGWEFLARVDALPGSNEFTLAIAPGVTEQIDRSLVTPGYCDHCSTKRFRKNTYLVREAATGAIRNVGSTCIKDFLGWSASFSFTSIGELSEELWGERLAEETYTPKTVITLAYLAIRKFGWVPASADRDQGHPTKYVMKHIIDPPMLSKNPSTAELKYREQLLECRELMPEAALKTPEIFAWIESLDDRSDFNINLKVAARAEEVTSKQFGILAYAPAGYDRSRQQIVERQAQELKPSEWVGTVGERITVSGTIKAINSFPTQFGVTTLYTIATEEGLVKWFASSPALGEDLNTPITIKGTVKKHETYRDVKATILTRCKEVA